MNNELKPVELTDDELEDVAGGYNPTKMYMKDETMDWFCTGCNKISKLVCTSATTRTGNPLKGFDYETTWVCTECGKGHPFVCHKHPYSD